MSKKITQKLDKVGRILIPASIRKELGLIGGETFSFGIEDGKLYMERAESTCILCGSRHDLIEYDLLVDGQPKTPKLCYRCRELLKKDLE